MRLQPGQHLSQAGVDRARKVGAGLQDIDYVVTSDLPRAIETAIAMGYAPDRTEPALASMMDADQEADWTQGCEAFARAFALGGHTARAAGAQAQLVRSIAEGLPEDGHALIVSHGGIIELGVVGLLPDLDYSGWGPACDYCEGVRLFFLGPDCTGAQLLRLPDLLRSS